MGNLQSNATWSLMYPVGVMLLVTESFQMEIPVEITGGDHDTRLSPRRYVRCHARLLMTYLRPHFTSENVRLPTPLPCHHVILCYVRMITTYLRHCLIRCHVRTLMTSPNCQVPHRLSFLMINVHPRTSSPVGECQTSRPLLRTLQPLCLLPGTDPCHVRGHCHPIDVLNMKYLTEIHLLKDT